MMKCETQPFDIEAKVRQDCYNRGYEQGRKNPAEEIVEYIEKLQKQVKEYQDKIEQGTLIELPVKVGDTVYCVYAATGIQEWEVSGIEILKNTILFLLGHTGTEDYNSAFLSEVGRYLFFTREEAEKRLKELQNGQ